MIDITTKKSTDKKKKEMHLIVMTQKTTKKAKYIIRKITRTLHEKL